MFQRTDTDMKASIPDGYALQVRRLPFRLGIPALAALLGCVPHEIPILVREGFLKPLGKPAPNGHKYFATAEVLELANNRQWLDKATRAIERHWKHKNRKTFSMHRQHVADHWRDASANDQRPAMKHQ